MDEPRRIWIGGRIDIMAEDRWVLWNLGAGLRGVQKVEREVMPVSEHDAQIVDLEIRIEADWRRLHEARGEIGQLRSALERIRDREWVENALDPQWAARIAREVLAVNPQEGVIEAHALRDAVRAVADDLARETNLCAQDSPDRQPCGTCQSVLIPALDQLRAALGEPVNPQEDE